MQLIKIKKKRETKSKKNYNPLIRPNLKFLELIPFKLDDLQNFRPIKNGIED